MRSWYWSCLGLVLGRINSVSGPMRRAARALRLRIRFKACSKGVSLMKIVTGSSRTSLSNSTLIPPARGRIQAQRLLELRERLRQAVLFQEPPPRGVVLLRRPRLGSLQGGLNGRVEGGLLLGLAVGLHGFVPPALGGQFVGLSNFRDRAADGHDDDEHRAAEKGTAKPASLLSLVHMTHSTNFSPTTWSPLPVKGSGRTQRTSARVGV